MLCWETLGSVIDIDQTLMPTSPLHIIAEQVHPIMAAALTNVSFSRITRHVELHGLFKNFAKHNGEFQMQLWLPDFPTHQHGRISVVCVRIRLVCGGFPNELKDLLATCWCQIPKNTF